MDQRIVDLIKAKQAEGVGLYEIRMELLKAGHPAEVVDAHIRFVREGGQTEVVVEKRPEIVSARRGPPGWTLWLGVVVLIVVGVSLGGVVTSLAAFGIGAIFWSWVIFWGGDRRLAGSMIMGFLAFLPSATSWKEGTVRLFAWISLLLGIANLIADLAGLK